MKLQYLRDWDAVDDKNNGETHVQYIDDKGENRTFTAPTWLLATMAVHLVKTHAPLCKGNDDNPAAWCHGCMEDARDALREEDKEKALASVRIVFQKKLILKMGDHLYTQQEIMELFNSVVDEVEAYDLVEE